VTYIHQKPLALVTGASRGIGASIAKGLARKGIHVIILARTIGALEEIDDEITGDGGSCTIVAMDLLDYPAIDRLGASIFERWGKLDILIGNAAILGQLSPIHHYDPKIWDEVIGINLTANYRLIRSLDPLLRLSKNGRVIFISSNISDGSHPYWGAYAASKAALETIAKVYSAETERLDLKINILDPGKTRTSLRAGAFPGEDPSKNKSSDEVMHFVLKILSDDFIGNGYVLNYQE
jgi:NAD(P)-dependent dehydrogenase (short-subunit alcohol dehydrogenase family)